MIELLLSKGADIDLKDIISKKLFLKKLFFHNNIFI